MSTVIVGAGLSGLTAARRLREAGEDIVILEATEHVAGRSRSDRERLLHGQPGDLGASFIDVGQDLLLQVCDDFGIEITPGFSLFPRDPDGGFSGASMMRNPLLLGGTLVDEVEREVLAAEVRGAIDAIPPSPTETLVAWARRAGLSPRATNAFTAQTGLNPVSIPEIIHMSHVHPPEIGKLCWMIADGTDTVARHLAEGLDIKLRQPVRLVSRASGRFKVETDVETHWADDVIVTSSVAATRRIAFDPVLPAWKIEALLGTSMVQGGKAITQYANGAAIREAIPHGAVSDGHVGMAWARPLGPDDSVVVLGLVPDRGDGILSDEPAVLDAMDDIVRSVTAAEPQRIAGFLQNWAGEEFYGGIVSLLSSNFLPLTATLGRQIGGLHFAGEHTADTWSTAMEGAMRSGMRVADEVSQRRRSRVGLGLQSLSS